MCFNQKCHFILIAHFICLLSYLYKAMSVIVSFCRGQRKNFENLLWSLFGFPWEAAVLSVADYKVLSNLSLGWKDELDLVSSENPESLWPSQIPLLRDFFRRCKHLLVVEMAKSQWIHSPVLLLSHSPCPADKGLSREDIPDWQAGYCMGERNVIWGWCDLRDDSFSTWFPGCCKCWAFNQAFLHPYFIIDSLIEIWLAVRNIDVLKEDK